MTTEELKSLLTDTCYKYRVSRAAVAERIGVTRQTLSNYYNGYADVNLDNVAARIRKAFPPEGASEVTILHSRGAVGAVNSSVQVSAASLGSLLEEVCYRHRVSRAHVARQLDITPQALNNFIHGHSTTDLGRLSERILEIFPLRESGVVNITHSPHAIGAVNSGVLVHCCTEGESIPVVPECVYMRRDTDIGQYTAQHSTETVSVPQADIAVRVIARDMEPLICRGDLLLLDKVPDVAPLIWGRVYAVNTRQSGLLIRRVLPDADGYDLRAEAGEPVVLPREEIIALYRVVACLRYDI